MMAFLMILEPAAPQTMEMLGILRISDVSGANRLSPGHFQNYENDTSLMHIS